MKRNIIVGVVVIAALWKWAFGPELHDPLQAPRNQTNAVVEQPVDVSTVAEAVVSNININFTVTQ
ncbi:MAG: hypothetical protein V4524_03015 [Patescibacteria group bacterium]